MKNTRQKVLVALGSGLLVGATAFVVNVFVSFDPAVLYRLAIGDLIAGVVAGLVALGIQLSYDRVYYRFAMERAAIVAEINHHVRNAVFPLCLAVQKQADLRTNQMANEAIARVNVALQDAMRDAFYG